MDKAFDWLFSTFFWITTISMAYGATIIASWPSDPVKRWETRALGVMGVGFILGLGSMFASPGIGTLIIQPEPIGQWIGSPSGKITSIVILLMGAWMGSKAIKMRKHEF